MLSPNDLKYLAQSIAQMSNQHVQAYENVNRMFTSGASPVKNPSAPKEEPRSIESSLRSVRPTQEFGRKLPSL